MAKRFTDSRKWDDDWLLAQESKNQILWIYMLDKCDHAGFFKPSLGLAGYCTHHSYTKEEVLKIFSSRIIVIKEDKWFIPKFIKFQYDNLNTESRLHLKIISILKNDLPLEVFNRVMTECQQSEDTLQAKDKDKDKVKDKVKKKKNIGLSDEDFLKSLKESATYSHINIDFELGKMDKWILVHKGRQKTRKFIINWLNKIEKPFTSPKKKEAPHNPLESPDPKENAKVSDLIRKTTKGMK